MAATDARPIPLKNQAYRVYFAILDLDGDPVPSAAGLDSERSLDGAAMADCTNEATYITGSAGGYFLDLTAAEMNTDCTYIEVKTTTVGAKTTPIVLYPQEADDLRVAVTHWVATAVATPTVAGVPEVDLTHWLGTAAATPTVAGVPEVDVTHVGGDATSLADLKDFADAGYDPATNKVQGVVLVDTLTTYTGNTPQTGDTFARLGAPAGASVSADVAAVKADSAAIKLKTDALPTDPADQSLVIAATDAIMTRLGTPAGASVSVDVAAVKTETASIQTDTNDIQARLPAVLVGGRMDASVGAMAADTVTAAALAVDAGTELADALLDRDMSVGTDSGSPSVRTVRQALRFLRNFWTVNNTPVANTLHVKKEDDTTDSWTAVVTPTPGTDPITQMDPA